MIVEFPREMLAVGIDDMRIHIGYHPALGMTGITLYRLDIAAAELQFDARAAVAQAVKYNRLEIVFRDQTFHLLRNLMFFIRSAVGLRNDEMIVLIFIRKVSFLLFLHAAVFQKRVNHRFRNENLPHTAFGLWCFQNERGSRVGFLPLREWEKDIISPVLAQGCFLLL